MDVIIYTSDPDEVSEAEVFNALEGLGYFVASVEILGWS